MRLSGGGNAGFRRAYALLNGRDVGRKPNCVCPDGTLIIMTDLPPSVKTRTVVLENFDVNKRASKTHRAANGRISSKIP